MTWRAHKCKYKQGTCQAVGSSYCLHQLAAASSSDHLLALAICVRFRAVAGAMLAGKFLHLGHTHCLSCPMQACTRPQVLAKVDRQREKQTSYPGAFSKVILCNCGLIIKVVKEVSCMSLCCLLPCLCFSK